MSKLRSNINNTIDKSILDPDQFEHSNHKENLPVHENILRDKGKHQIIRKMKEVTDIPHPLDRHSGNGIGKYDKKHGAGKANWGTLKDDLRLMEEETESKENIQQDVQLNTQQPGSTESPKQQSTPIKQPEIPPPEVNDENFPKLI